eukprot:CAMPEP_0113883620 /NCGR_PEP_ID=MMETSP0780_2-20120614/9721_1 /TAXON_ID=652834 /ORGANISM="Palpitomonas bilix" /LENGTH=533 /DNA_ID=CAMNT_0000870985 /DNA_START=90 /DNA_END=1691 /DNA_ORIENTATION=- /assembly_acc=CAM_ASM_000599
MTFFEDLSSLSEAEQKAKIQENEKKRREHLDDLRKHCLRADEADRNEALSEALERLIDPDNDSAEQQKEEEEWEAVGPAPIVVRGKSGMRELIGQAMRNALFMAGVVKLSEEEKKTDLVQKRSDAAKFLLESIPHLRKISEATVEASKALEEKRSALLQTKSDYFNLIEEEKKMKIRLILDSSHDDSVISIFGKEFIVQKVENELARVHSKLDELKRKELLVGSSSGGEEIADEENLRSAEQRNRRLAEVLAPFLIQLCEALQVDMFEFAGKDLDRLFNFHEYVDKANTVSFTESVVKVMHAAEKNINVNLNRATKVEDLDGYFSRDLGQLAQPWATDVVFAAWLSKLPLSSSCTWSQAFKVQYGLLEKEWERKRNIGTKLHTASMKLKYATHLNKKGTEKAIKEKLNSAEAVCKEVVKEAEAEGFWSPLLDDIKSKLGMETGGGETSEATRMESEEFCSECNANTPEIWIETVGDSMSKYQICLACLNKTFEPDLCDKLEEVHREGKPLNVERRGLQCPISHGEIKAFSKFA